MPTAKLRCAIVTYNIAGKSPPIDSDVQLLAPDVYKGVDVVAVGLQELPVGMHTMSSIYEHSWSSYFRDCLAAHGYIQLCPSAATTGRVCMLMFVTRRVLDALTSIHCTAVWHEYSTGKATVLVSLVFGAQTRITFLTSHLTPHSDSVNLSRRVEQVRQTTSQFDKLLSTDLVFWCGDFNFRCVTTDRPSAIRRATTGVVDDLKFLLHSDQMNRCVTAGEIFTDFVEPSIRFRPTYKMIFGEPVYDVNRDPSWCDRILYRVNPSQIMPGRTVDAVFDTVNCDVYDSVNRCTFSDHVPVYARFTMNLASDSCLSPYWAITFTNVSNAGQQYYVGLPLELHYAFQPEYQKDVSSFDTICILRDPIVADYQALVHWQYTVTSWQKELTDNTQWCITVAHDRLPSTGRYRVAYYSRYRSCLVGLSNAFEIVTIETGSEASVE